ncbi:CCA tRNA nucleotidyltransferase [Candidatus Bathyarchaeota archaeon]|nr:CCA tRNA nucleotidyltransferase [Candidatus Bathyarchaeota archaeon]NIR17547.1 CCA tRNA nucleotidyltransferase [Desulfobacterales bacterium]NIU81235.1 CCA tRNA nucleotidyltransferase [Candidatus Bathyarchaeota archaeon]NIV67885.1 CCA tRNA nucleotidyltransferase [Candidatus Bathyarchaeota archaeon]NIW16329.1 CCA tRNA nucleotidyltransferase [Candidatus Bathyarchaeota archaeon]
MSPNLKPVLAKVSERVTPSEEEREHILEWTEELRERVLRAAEEEGIEAKVRVEGSVAKDTWLSGEPEIDIFLQVPTSIPREELGKICLRIARRATEGFEQIERFAEHPYLEAIVDNVTVNIVPCYQVERRKWKSATDRTPFHTDYVKARLNKELCKEVRLLKRFLKGIGIYGAEIRVGGFSGYLCELLVLNYGSFTQVLESFAEWEGRRTIDYRKRYRGEQEDLERTFEEPLVVVDPVDRERNVAAAVRKESLSEFVAAGRRFLKNPDLKFFYPPERAALSPTELVKALETRGTALVLVKFGGVDAVPDVLWGQLQKSNRSLRRLLERHNFRILRDSIWSNKENTDLILLFEVEQKILPSIKKHLGPPITRRKECEDFLQKYLGADHTLSGPYMEGDRWVVEMRRDYTHVSQLLTEKLSEDARRLGVAQLVAESIAKGFEVLVNEQVLDFYSSSLEFARFLTEYLEGNPSWLRYPLIDG